MAVKAQTVALKETYCAYCHLSTRADHGRCLHCGKPLGTSLPGQAGTGRAGPEGNLVSEAVAQPSASTKGVEDRAKRLKAAS